MPSVLIGQVYSESTYYYESQSFKSKTLIEFLDEIQEMCEIIITYNPGSFDAEKNFKLPNGKFTIHELIRLGFRDYFVEWKNTSANRYLLIVRNRTEKPFLTGYIKDKNTGEMISGVLIHERYSNQYAFTNENGYYTIRPLYPLMDLELRYLGYLAAEYKIDNEKEYRKNLYMDFDNELSPIIISTKPLEQFIFDPGGIAVTARKIANSFNILGESDLLKSINSIPGVVTSGEAQTGVLIRGGSADHTLILVDGMPMYEVNHSAGISSIFISEGVRAAQLFKSSMPARYNGRLGAALNIQLKEGNVNELNSTLSMGLFGLRFHIEGPIHSQKTSYAISVRNSWIDYLISPLTERFTNFKEIDLRYRDLMGKITHRFNENTKMSLSLYTGGDNIFLYKEEERGVDTSKFETTEINSLKWSNTLMSLNFEQILSPKSKWFFQTGLLSYSINSRGAYGFNDLDGGNLIEEAIDVRSVSEIFDWQMSSSFDYYFSDHFKLKTGFNLIRHQFLPTVRQSLDLQPEELALLNPDSIISGNAIDVFTEANISLSKKIFLYPGVTLSQYAVRNRDYYYFLPRMRWVHLPDENTLLALAYTRSSQFIHLLANPGLGIPSDLWVPSTENISPQTGNHFSFDISRKFKTDQNIQFGVFYRQMFNLLEYNQVIDLFANIIQNEDLTPVFNSQLEWERQVERGRGKAWGAECGYRKETNRYSIDLSYTYTRSVRTFESINGGLSFPSRVDRPHQINIDFRLLFFQNSGMELQWNYLSGSSFSLATEEFDSVFGIRLLRASGRNNYRLPAFHQLSLNYFNDFEIKSIGVRFNAGVYNVYNRLNAFYIYAFRRESDRSLGLRKVSVFPLVPNFNITFIW
jgi:hypothetical protein